MLALRRWGGWEEETKKSNRYKREGRKGWPIRKLTEITAGLAAVLQRRRLEGGESRATATRTPDGDRGLVWAGRFQLQQRDSNRTEVAKYQKSSRLGSCLC